MVDDYNIIGVIFALSILQNGPLPQFLNAEIREQLFGSTADSSCILALKDGFDKLGLVDLFAAVPMLVFLFQPSESSILTRKKLIHLLSPNYSPHGSNQRISENELYEFMMKYIRKTVAGRVPSITLEYILQFVKCCDNKPVLGFALNPTINFTPVRTFKSKWDFTPIARTCSYVLELPVRTATIDLLPDDLFDVYSTAFANAYFGKF